MLLARDRERVGSVPGSSAARRRAVFRASFDPGIVPKTGTMLVRQWHGDAHAVLVREDGFEYEGQRYRSLTVIAERITGAHWSGPRFFGLTKRAGKLKDSHRLGTESFSDSPLEETVNCEPVSKKPNSLLTGK